MSSYDQYLNMGFTKAQIMAANQLCKSHRNTEMLDVLLRQQNSPMKQQDSQILKEYSFDVLTPDQRQRVPDLPVGLKNMANVCYLNSLIQTYFHNPIFVKEILCFKFPLSLSFESLLTKNEAKAKRIKSSINLVVHLQRLFTYLVLSDRKYVDPFQVFLNVVDEFGNRFQLGDQKDLAEFNLQFITCLDEGLKYDEDKVLGAEISAAELQTHSSNSHCESVILLDEKKAKRIESQIMTQSAILSKSQSVMSGLFFGKTKEFINYLQNDQVKESEENEQVFLQIILNVASKNLYSAWEANSQFQIENYRSNNEVIQAAQKTIWITEIPDSLLFQIQRVGYDPERGLIKLNQEFRFEKEIYADRFLLENRKLVQETSSALGELKFKKDELQKQINSYLNYNKSNQSMINILSNARQYVIEQQKLVVFDENEDPIIKRIDETKLSVNLIIANLQHQIDEINNEIEKHYSIMKQHKYTLHSILIHEGAAESGHYYVYIYNALLKQWYKFNDIHVNQVSEEKVMKDAYGDGKQKMNAYCLIYQKEESFELSSFTNYSKQSAYKKYIQANLIEEVIKDNQKLIVELDEHQLVEIGDMVVEIYNVQFQQVNEMARKFKQHRNSKPPLNNFSCFLRFVVDSMNDLVKWAVLDSAIREATQGGRSLKDICKSQILHQRIKYHFDQMVQYKVPSKFELDKQTTKNLKYYYAEYIQSLKVTSAQPYIDILNDAGEF